MIQQYFNDTSSKLENGEFVLLKIKEETHPENFHSNTESINFLIYMWCLSNQKFRIPELFDYVLIPKDLPDHDFSDVNFEEFFDFLCSIKIG